MGSDLYGLKVNVIKRNSRALMPDLVVQHRERPVNKSLRNRRNIEQ